MGAKEMTTTKTQRMVELDWLRVLAIGVVFLYHSTRFFNLGDWHVKNIDTYIWVEMWTVFASRWMMPLFFIISGVSLYHALDKSEGFGKFCQNKFTLDDSGFGGIAYPQCLTSLPGTIDPRTIFRILFCVSAELF